MTPSVTVNSPAKINLSLGVGPVRDDGFHPLATVYQAVGLFDWVRATPGDGLSLTASSQDVEIDEVPLDERNLAWRAAELLARSAERDPDVTLHIHKRIPVAGGLAGGSTNAAAALVACDSLWNLRTPREHLLELAAELGSDVPFCLVGGTAIGSGRGEVVTPVMTRGSYYWVILPAEVGLSTPEVYAAFDDLADDVPAMPEIPTELLSGLRRGDVAAIGQALRNDLQEAACGLAPFLGARLAEGLDWGAAGAIVSGSGPSTAFLVADVDSAMELSQALSVAFGVTATWGEAPVHGARIVEAHW